MLTTAPSFALLCRGHAPSRFATPNLPFWERVLPRPVPPRVAMRYFPLLSDTLLTTNSQSVTRLARTNPNDLFAALEHPSRKRPSPPGAGRPGLWLLSACALDRHAPTLRRQQDAVAARLMNAQRSDGYLAAGTGPGRWSRGQIHAYGENLRGLLAYYALSRSPAAIYAAMQAGDLVVTQFPSVTANAGGTDSLVLPLTLLYQATGEGRYRQWAEKRASAGRTDGAGLCALYVATGETPYLQSARRVWQRDCAHHRADPDLAASLWTLTGGHGYLSALRSRSTPWPCPIVPGAAAVPVSAVSRAAFEAVPLTQRILTGPHHGRG